MVEMCVAQPARNRGASDIERKVGAFESFGLHRYPISEP
jgi:hypothetical protein